MHPHLTDPLAVVREGERIYNEKYRAKLEATHRGEFVVIDVSTGLAYLGHTPDAAFEAARAAAPEGTFHLIQVGSLGAFRSSHITADAHTGRLFH